MEGGGEQFNGREGETATFYERRSLNLNLRGGSFAPRHLSRSALASYVRYNPLHHEHEPHSF